MGATTVSLQAAFDLANSRAGIAIFIVGAGIVMEVAVLLIFSQEMTRREKLALLVSNIIILVGCGGEWWYGRQAATAASELQIRASVRIAALSRETAALNKNAADLNREAAAAKLAASQAQLNLAKVETPRTITPTQQRLIITALEHAPKGPVSVIYPFTDSTDAKPYSEAISSTLKKAGYLIVPEQGQLRAIISFSAPGAYLIVHDVKHPPVYAGPIQHAFGRVGIFLEGLGKPEQVGPTQVVIVVSSHPFYPERVPKELRGIP